MRRFFRDVLIALLIPIRAVVRLCFPAKEVAILLYHSIGDSNDAYAVSPKDFGWQLAMVRNTCVPVRLSDIVNYVLGKGDLPDHAIAVTFDDGYRDVLQTALPLLRAFNIPATVFVSTDPSMQELGNQHPLLTETEIRELSREPLIEIGSHAVTHRKLTRISADEVRDELQNSKRELESITGLPCRYIAYPKGSANSEVHSLTRLAGYDAGVTVKQGMIVEGADHFFLKRVIVQKGIGDFAFRWRLTRIMDWMASLDRMLKR